MNEQLVSVLDHKLISVDKNQKKSFLFKVGLLVQKWSKKAIMETIFM